MSIQTRTRRCAVARRRLQLQRGTSRPHGPLAPEKLKTQFHTDLRTKLHEAAVKRQGGTERESIEHLSTRYTDAPNPCISTP